MKWARPAPSREIHLPEQAQLFEDRVHCGPRQTPPKGQLLKWIGNKQRMAAEIVSFFPRTMNAYHEPFLGSGAVLATVVPRRGFASDAFGPLMEIWWALKTEPAKLNRWYHERWNQMMAGEKVEQYELIKASYNARPNGADLVFLARSCYGGVVRFRKADGYMSTPCGAHRPIAPEDFADRIERWRHRLQSTQLDHMEYEEALGRTKPGDLVYCDPPYSDSQTILYGAQSFKLANLLESIERCKRRGVSVALSIDGSKRSGDMICDLSLPKGLFEQELFITVGRSPLRRFQMGGRTLEREVVADRLLLTY